METFVDTRDTADLLDSYAAALQRDRYDVAEEGWDNADANG